MRVVLPQLVRVLHAAGSSEGVQIPVLSLVGRVCVPAAVLALSLTSGAAQLANLIPHGAAAAPASGPANGVAALFRDVGLSEAALERLAVAVVALTSRLGRELAAQHVRVCRCLSLDGTDVGRTDPAARGRILAQVQPVPRLRRSLCRPIRAVLHTVFGAHPQEITQLAC
jgi:hypothetical protein